MATDNPIVQKNTDKNCQCLKIYLIFFFAYCNTYFLIFEEHQKYCVTNNRNGTKHFRLVPFLFSCILFFEFRSHESVKLGILGQMIDKRHQ